MTDEVEGFAAMFSMSPGPAPRERREARALRERRAQMTDKQRKRAAVRTAQINFRCSPEFKDRAARMAKGLDCGIADLMERALDALAAHKKLKGDDNV